MRRLLHPEDPRALAARKLDEFVGVGKKESKPRGTSLARARKELRQMMTSGNFSKAKSCHLVALYEWCHEQVYGVAPAELEQMWTQAVFAASNLVKKQFGGDVESAVEFVRWTWQREQWRLKKRPESQVFRVGWKLQFVNLGFVTDYRMYLARG